MGRKIDEPDTPYARYDPAEDPDVVQGASPLSPPKELQPVRSTSLDDHLGDLSEKLARAATDSEKPRAALFVEEEERDEAKARAFAAKRQQHYNMAGLLGRKWDEEDEMEDEDLRYLRHMAWRLFSAHGVGEGSAHVPTCSMSAPTMPPMKAPTLFGRRRLAGRCAPRRGAARRIRRKCI